MVYRQYNDLKLRFIESVHSKIPLRKCYKYHQMYNMGPNMIGWERAGTGWSTQAGRKGRRGRSVDIGHRLLCRAVQALRINNSMYSFNALLPK